MRNGKRLMLPIGIEDFKEIRQDGFYYVDKTGMIRELLETRGKVNLFTRPRRFGKSLNLSMLRHFFEIGTDAGLFAGLEIEGETELMERHLGRYPVIFVSLRNVEGASYRSAVEQLCAEIARESMRFSFLEGSENLTTQEKALYRKLIQVSKREDRAYEMSEAVLSDSLGTLSRLLCRHFGQKVVILIDEYDVPLAKADEWGYYKDMVLLIRKMFHSALKTNEDLFMAVLTGCLRISRESIFTGLNNLLLYTLLDDECDERFGFTDAQVRTMLDYFGLSERYGDTKEWYNGYLIGGKQVYNPWDVINWVHQLLEGWNPIPRSYWTNSSGNVELRRFVQKLHTDSTRMELERLISGQTVQKRIEEQLTYDSIYDSMDNLWSLLFATGYLTPREKPVGNLVKLVIPNAEVRLIFQNQVLSLFKESVKEDGSLLHEFGQALKLGDAPRIEQLFTKYLGKTISIRDTAVRKEHKESFYHGLLLGLLGYQSAWSVTSNGEAGLGYYDIAVEIPDEEIGLLIEVKYAESGAFERECKAALAQMERNDYTAELLEDGMQTILKVGIACRRKECKVVVER